MPPLQGLLKCTRAQPAFQLLSVSPPHRIERHTPSLRIPSKHTPRALTRVSRMTEERRFSGQCYADHDMHPGCPPAVRRRDTSPQMGEREGQCHEGTCVPVPHTLQICCTPPQPSACAMIRKKSCVSAGVSSPNRHNDRWYCQGASSGLEHM